MVYRIRYKMEIDVFQQSELAHTPLGLSLKQGQVRLAPDDAYDFLVPQEIIEELLCDVGLTILAEIDYEAILDSLKKSTDTDREHCARTGQVWQDRDEDRESNWSMESIVDKLIEELPQTVGSSEYEGRLLCRRLLLRRSATRRKLFGSNKTLSKTLLERIRPSLRESLLSTSGSLPEAV